MICREPAQGGVRDAGELCGLFVKCCEMSRRLLATRDGPLQLGIEGRQCVMECVEVLGARARLIRQGSQSFAR